VKERDWDSCYISDGSLKWLARCIVSAEMLIYKLLPTQAAVIKHLFFT
jgi:hypothetical protein